MAAFVAPDGQEVVKVLEILTIAVPIDGINPDGSPDYEDGADGDLDWNSQRPARQKGQFVYLTEGGQSWTFDQLTAVPDEDDAEDEE